MRNFAEALTDQLVQLQIIREEDRELYSYGFRQGIVLVVNLLVIVAIGLLLDVLWQSLVFIAAYTSLRTVAGGYHARTQRRCFIFSALLIVTVLGAMKWIPVSLLACAIIISVSLAAIIVLAPVGDENKPLNETEVRVYRKRSRFISTALALVSALFLVLDNVAVASCIAISMLSMTLMLILGKLKNILNKARSTSVN